MQGIEEVGARDGIVLKRFSQMGHRSLLLGLCLGALLGSCKSSEKEVQSTQAERQASQAQTQAQKVTPQSSQTSRLSFRESPEPGKIVQVEIQDAAAGDWLTLLPQAAETMDWGEQVFIAGKNKARLRVPAYPGQYEIRLFRQWPNGGTEPVERLGFETTGNKGDATAGPWTLNAYDLEYVKDQLAPVSWGQSSVPTDTRPFETLSAEPVIETVEGETLKKIYGYFDLGNSQDSRYSFMIVGDKFYIDRNNNEDLSDDGEPLLSNGSGSVALEIELLDAQGQSQMRPYQVWYFFNASMNGYQMYSKSFYQGKVSFHGYDYQALVYEDQNHNGLLRDNGIWIDSDGNGKFEPSEHYYHHDRVPVGPNYFELLLSSL